MTEKVYLENPYLRQIDARIIEKEYLNDKYYIKTDKTIFYPNLAGGQPGDKGTINGVQVIDTYEEDSHIIHVIQENIHSDKVSLAIDWDNRLDYMQQHSGQHLLSSVFYKLFNAETKGFYIGRDHVYIDVKLPYLTESGIEKIEKFANKIIFSNFPIKSYIVEKDQVDCLPLAHKKTSNSSSRIIEIDGIDFTPCCGTHLRSTGEIGLVKIKSYEEIKDGLRVSFICGSRALDDYRWTNNYLSQISHSLKCERELILENISSKLELQALILQENKDLKSLLLKIEADKILADAESYKDLKLINKDLEGLSSDQLAELAQLLIARDNKLVFLSSKKDQSANFVFSYSQNLKDYIEGSFDDLILEGNIYQGICHKDDRDDYMRDFFNRIIEKL